MLINTTVNSIGVTKDRIITMIQQSITTLKLKLLAMKMRRVLTYFCDDDNEDDIGEFIEMDDQIPVPSNDNQVKHFTLTFNVNPIEFSL